MHRISGHFLYPVSGQIVAKFKFTFDVVVCGGSFGFAGVDVGLIGVGEDRIIQRLKTE